TSPYPLLKAVMVYLSEIWPDAVPFHDLLRAARGRLGLDTSPNAVGLAQDAQSLGRDLLQGFSANLVKLHLHRPSFVRILTERPVASPVVRLQAVAEPRVTNVGHSLVQLNDFERQVAIHLDGSRDQTALVDALMDVVAKGDLRVQQNNQPVTDPQKLRAILGEALAASLPKFAQLALLVG